MRISDGVNRQDEGQSSGHGGRQPLVRLAAWSISVLTAVFIVGAVVVSQIERADAFSYFAPFGGWQVDAAEAGLCVAGVGMLGVSTWRLVRLHRVLRRRTKYARVAIEVALLPGLALGGFAASMSHDAIGWASDHTAQARVARAHLQVVLASYRRHPPLPPLFGSPAPASLSGKLLTASDLGAGWYAVKATMSDLPAGDPARAFGASTQVRTAISQQHWSGSIWTLRELVLERIYPLSSAHAAGDYLARGWSRQPDFCGCVAPGPSRKMHFGRVTVWEHDVETGYGSRSAVFAVRGDVIIVAVSGFGDRRLTSSRFTKVVAAAIAKAGAAS